MQAYNKSFDDSGNQWAWDSTCIRLAETCLRKYFYKMIEGWQARRLSVHLEFGSLYATALEHYYKHRALGLSSDEALVEVVHEALIGSVEYEMEDGNWIDGIEARDLLGDKLPAPWTGQWRPKPWNHNLKTRETLIRTIVWYVDQFEDEEIEVIRLADGKPAVELSFTLDLGNGIALCGHLDRLVRYSGEPYVMDQKTTNITISPRFFEKFSPDTQMSAYAFAGKAVYNTPVKGVIIDAAQIAVGFSRFERGFIPRTEDQLEEWLDGALWWIALARDATQRFNDGASLAKAFPMNTSSCDLYGGCEFRNVCGRSPSVRQQFLKADFVKGERWDPLARR